MEEEATLFHDHSTFEGRLSLLLHRIKWKYLIPPAVFLTAFAGVGILLASLSANPKSNIVQLAPGNSLLGADDPAIESSHVSAGWTVITQPAPGVIQAEGCENGLYAFEGFDATVDIATAKHLRIRYLVIDAAALTRDLKEWTSLETIVIENVWVNGNFSRVYLPNLTKFIYHQYRNGKTDQYKQPETLKQTLFFDKSPTETWDLHKDLLNLNMSIQVSVEGTKILDIEPDSAEININTHDCENMVKNFDATKSFPLSSLSLSWCPVKLETIQKLRENNETLNYLLLNNAIPSSTQELGEATSSLQHLKELHLFQRFHCDWAGYEIYLNLSTLSRELETLSITNLDLTGVDNSLNSLRNLSLDQYVGENVVSNFNSIFPNLWSLAVFNVTASRSYPLLEKALLSQVTPELVIVTNFTRTKQKQSGGMRVEKVLEEAGVPPNAVNFKLERVGGSYRGREMTSFEANFYRFTRLAFKKIDTYADYVTWDAEPK